MVPTADTRQNEVASRIEGDVIVTGSARGNAVIFLYDAARPPPPAGTGRPLTFTTLSRARLFGDSETGNGPFTAPFTFSLVKPGSYLVRGLIDVSDDFIPWYGVTADSNTGDVGGAAIDPVTRAPRVITIEGGPALDVAVSFSDAARIAVDRPAFQVATQAPAATVMPGQPPVVLELKPQPIDEGPVKQPQPVFLAQLIDDDRDGVPDDRNGDGVPDQWPRVVVRKLADGDNLLADDQGDYTHVVNNTPQSPDGVPDTVVLAAGIDPTENLPLLVDAMGAPRPQPVPVTKLKVVIRPVALDGTNPLQPVPLVSMPSGRYALILIAPTGQTWRVPNELAPGVGSRFGLPELASQGFLIQVP